MLRNMAASLIRSVVDDEDLPNRPKTPGRIVTTVAKAKELRPFVEKLVTMARKALVYKEQASQYATTAPPGSNEWRQWRQSEQWQRWNQAIAPAVALRRRAFAILRDKEAVSILFDDLAYRFRDRNGGYTRVVRLAERRLGDAGQKALIEFVGKNDRVPQKGKKPPVTVEDEPLAVEEEEATTQETQDVDSTAEGEARAEATQPEAEGAEAAEGSQAQAGESPEGEGASDAS